MKEVYFSKEDLKNHETKVNYLKNKLSSKARRNNVKLKYYNQKDSKTNIGIIPSNLRGQYKSALGWNAKAVDSLADRMVFRGFKNDNYNLEELFNVNNPDIFFDSAILSALINSCAFVYISEDENKYPKLEVIEASSATGIIDPTTGLLKEGYAVLEFDSNGKPWIEAYFEPNRTIYHYYEDDTYFEFAHNVDYPLLVPIIHRPDAFRPFGRSRITRATMSLQDSAKRTLERAEITSEFYSFPQKYLLNTDSDFAESVTANALEKWQATISSMIVIPRGSDENEPKVGQFQTSSMAPFSEHLRTLASAFAGETGLTLDDLGFSTDNPSSSEAIKASHETLRISARKAQRTIGSGFLNVGYLARCLADGVTYRRDMFYQTKPEWEQVFDPDSNSISGIGDAVIKINQAIPGYFGKDNIRDLTGIEPSEETPTTTDWTRLDFS